MEIIKHSPLNPIWLKASVIGSLWASVEIVAGSFLHNLQIPFSGTILTLFAIFLLSAFTRLWNEGGLIWRAGIICALMKSISPSAIIIGPMVGIITESFLFELVLMLLGRNVAGMLVGGGITAVSAIIHKLFTLLILYGFDFVRILDSLYHYAAKQLKIPNAQPMDLIWILAGVYFALGLFASLSGFWVGNNFVKREGSSEVSNSFKIRSDNVLLGIHERQSYSTLLILVHLASMTAVLWLLNLNSYFAAGSVALGYTAFCVYRYPGSLRRLRKVSVWLQFLFIVFSSVLIWDLIAGGTSNGESGWVIGSVMVFRAFLLIVGFAAISVELKNPLVKTVLYKQGLADLYQSLRLAFGVLPDLLKSLSNSRLSILNPSSLLSHLLGNARNLIGLFEEEQKKQPPIFILTGEVGSGKTTFLMAVLDSVRKQGCFPGGFIAIGNKEENLRSGFTLVDLKSEESILLSSTAYQEGWQMTGRYYFNPEALKFGNNLLDPGRLQGIQLVVIDEIGPLELKNQGWSGAVERLISRESVPQLWVVRQALVQKMIRKWNVGDIVIFDISKDPADLVASTILGSLT